MTRDPETTTERVKSVLRAAFGQFHLWLVGGIAAYLFWYGFSQPVIGMSARPVEAFFGGIAIVTLLWAAKLSAEETEIVDALDPESAIARPLPR